MTIVLRKLALGVLVLLGCSRTPDDAGIVLNVDTEVAADRALIDQITVTVDGRRQAWTLAQPLPGSLGITTSPGAKSVTVQGLATGTLRGTWSDTIVIGKGTVVVKDVHLSPAGNPADAGTWDSAAQADSRDGPGNDALDGARRDAGDAGVDARDGALDGGPDGARRDAAPDVNDAPAVDAARDVADSRAVNDSGEVRGLDGAPFGYDAATARLTGAFTVSSQFELRAAAAAPGVLGDTLGLVHGLVSDPGDAILGFADQAGVPALGTLRSVLPDALESRLSGWINSYIKTAVGGVSPYDQLVVLDDLVQSLLLTWGLQSTLALPLDRSGTHAPVSLVFTSSVAIPLDPTASVTSGIDVVASIAWPDGPDGAAVIAVGDHFMGFPFGRYALQALNAILLARYGTPNVAAYLSDAVGCEGMANSVSSQCVSVVCVGHKDDLLSVCEGGLAEAASQIEDQILGLDFKAIHYQRGSAVAGGAVVTRPQDALAWQDGVWTVTVDLGSGEQPATATFTALAAGAP
jgi:hypothetical protein